MSLWWQSKLAGTVTDDYYRHVVPHLEAWRTAVQTGIRAGTTVRQHILTGALLIDNLKSIFNLSQEEQRLLMLAFTLHDLNKLCQNQNASLGRLTDDAALVKGTAEDLGLDFFFPGWEDYLYDVLSLIRGHSGHHHLLGYDFVPGAGRIKLPAARLDQLTHVIRAVDVLDLSSTYGEQEFKDKALFDINAASPRQYRWAAHKLAEHRGVFSNIIHNQLVALIRDEMEAQPLLVYPEGVWYLIPADSGPPDRELFLHRLVGKVRLAVESLKIQDLAKVVTMSRNAGIKMDASVIGAVTPEKLLAAAEVLIYKRRSNIEEMQEKLRNRWVKKTIVLDEFLLAQGLRIFSTEEELQGGELIRTTYNLVKNHFASVVSDPWTFICGELGLPAERFTLFDGLNDRPFVLAANVSGDFGSLRAITLDIWQKLYNTLAAKSPAVEADYLYSYLAKVAWVDPVTRPAPHDLATFFQAYCREGHKQDCFGAFEGKTEKLMEKQVPGIKVQQFSNRLAGGGSAEPKRNVSAVTKEQLFLERMAFRSMDNTKSVYLHFMPARFMPYVQLDHLRLILTGLAGDEDVLHGLDEKALAQGWERLEKEMFTATKSEGVAFPRHAETVGGTISLPLYLRGEETAERSLRALEYAAHLAAAFDLKVVVSESPVVALGAEDFDYLYLDNATGRVAGFFGTCRLTRVQTDSLLADLKVLHGINLKLKAKPGDDHLVTLAASLGDGALKMFGVMDDLVEKKLHRGSRTQNPEWQAIRLAATFLEDIEVILNRRYDMEKVSTYLQEMAVLAWESGIRGKSLERNSLLDPLNRIFDHFRRETATLDPEARRAVLAETLFAHLERIDEHAGLRKIKATENYVNLFFMMLDKVYEGRINWFLNEEKELKAAYLFYLRRRIMAASANKEGKKSTEGEDQA